jgi:N-acetylneuraminic acid mutarotase
MSAMNRSVVLSSWLLCACSASATEGPPPDGQDGAGDQTDGRPRSDATNDGRARDGGSAGERDGAGSTDAPASDAGRGCRPGSEVCGGRCADLTTDSENCSACGRPCLAGTACFAGHCAAPTAMPTARGHAVATRGTDGRIYVIGGALGRSGAVSTDAVEIYDPRTNGWSQAAHLQVPRHEHAVVTAPGGLIYVVGGITVTADAHAYPLASVEVYDYTSDSWTNERALPTTLELPAAAVGPSGEIDVLGGVLPYESTTLSDSAKIWTLDPATHAWSLRGTMPIPRHAAAAAQLDGRVYLMGGASTQQGMGAALDRVDVYDPAAAAWMPASPFPAAASELPAVVVDGAIYAFDQLETDALYDPGTGAWAKLPSAGVVRNGFAAAGSTDSRVFLFGGYTASVVGYGPPTAATMVYEPRLRRWVPEPPP